jgi:hypothetical protein
MDLNHAPYGSHLNPLLPFNHPKKFQMLQSQVWDKHLNTLKHTLLSKKKHQFNDVVETVIMH